MTLLSIKTIVVCVCIFGLLAGQSTGTVQNIVVDKSGSGNFTTVQEAVNAVKAGNSERVIIVIRAGTYREKVIVPSDKPFITFEGAGMHKSIITWDDSKLKLGATHNTATVDVAADRFTGRSISFRNTAPRRRNGGQAIALRVSGDAAAFYSCGMYGYQDTLNDDQGRHLFRNCHIEGAVDFIFGSGRSLYEKCTIKSIATSSGSVTAQGRLSKKEISGFGFVHCKIVGTGKILLGRAWGPYARVVIASSHIGGIIDSTRWSAWRVKDAKDTTYYGEYGNHGAGAHTTGDNPLVRHLSHNEAEKFTQIKWIDGSSWLEE